MMFFLSENAVPLWMWWLWAREKHNQLAELIPFQPDKHIHLYLGRIQLAPCLFPSRYVVWGSSQTKLPSQSIVNVPKTRDLCHFDPFVDTQVMPLSRLLVFLLLGLVYSERRCLDVRDGWKVGDW